MDRKICPLKRVNFFIPELANSVIETMPGHKYRGFVLVCVLLSKNLIYWSHLLCKELSLLERSLDDQTRPSCWFRRMAGC